MKIYCPNCSRENVHILMAAGDTYADNEGYSAVRMICSRCSLLFGARQKHVTPPCKRCGHTEETFIKHEGIAPPAIKYTGTADGREAEEVMRALRGY